MLLLLLFEDICNAVPLSISDWFVTFPSRMLSSDSLLFRVRVLLTLRVPLLVLVLLALVFVMVPVLVLPLFLPLLCLARPYLVEL